MVRGQDGASRPPGLAPSAGGRAARVCVPSPRTSALGREVGAPERDAGRSPARGRPAPVWPDAAHPGCLSCHARQGPAPSWGRSRAKAAAHTRAVLFPERASSKDASREWRCAAAEGGDRPGQRPRPVAGVGWGRGLRKAPASVRLSGQTAPPATSRPSRNQRDQPRLPNPAPGPHLKEPQG